MTAADRVHVMLVDDESIVRQGLRVLIDGEDGISVVGEAGDGEAAVAEVLRCQPDVVVMDVRLGPGIDGIEACRLVRSERPETQVLMLTSFGSNEAVLAALMAGAAGFVLKASTEHELVHAIHAVARGESLLDPAVTRAATERLVELARHDEDPLIADLTEAERLVLPLLAEGLTNKEIAVRLGKAEKTVRNQVSSVLQKFNVPSRAAAAAIWTRLGMDNSSAQP